MTTGHASGRAFREEQLKVTRSWLFGVPGSAFEFTGPALDPAGRPLSPRLGSPAFAAGRPDFLRWVVTPW